MDEWIKKMWNIYKRILLSLTKGEPAIYNNVAESIGYYAKSNKPDTERKTPHDLTYMQNLFLKSNKY
jgi:hypothetical protein